jgi:hypothetical protein
MKRQPREQLSVARARNSGRDQRRWLSGRGSPRSSVQSERILRRGIIRQSGMPRNFPCFRNEVQRSRGQRRHVQRLADVASGVRAAGVLVRERAASREVQEGHAA